MASPPDFPPPATPALQASPAIQGKSHRYATMYARDTAPQREPMTSTPDTLSTLLRSIHLSGGVYFRCEFSAPWSLEIAEKPDAEFHVVVSGNCWIAPSNGQSPVALATGDVAVFLDGARHQLLDTPRGKALASEDVIGDTTAMGLGPVRFGGGAPVSILCGYFRFDRDNLHPVLQALPAFIHVGGGSAQGIDAIIHLMHQETVQTLSGREATLDRLSELLFIQILRAHVQASTNRTGLLAAIKDPKIGASLSYMHAKPEAAWTLDTMARSLAMSRSAFAARFTELVGQTPMNYLTTVRLLEARRLLRESSLTTFAIAERVGYGSEAALGKAFKRAVGGPGAFRKRAEVTLGTAGGDVSLTQGD